MSTATDRAAAKAQTEAATVATQMQAAIGEIAAQRNGAQARTVELAVALAAAHARITTLEAEVARLAAAEKEWRTLADAAKG